MQHETRFTMIAPNAGFTSRVMARIAEHERAKARQRALIGSALLVIAAIIILALVALWLVSWVAVLVSMPQLAVAVLGALATLAFWVGVALNACWVAVGAIAENIGAVQMVVLALVVFALTMVWMRVVVGPFQFSSHTISVGG
jgi:hypothetical protein